MSDYIKSVNFAAKDALPGGDPNKIVKGTEIDTEYNNIATASATKFDTADLASTAQAEAGTNDTTLMTPLKTAEAITLQAESATFTPTGGISATNILGAIAELDTEKAPKASPVFTGTITIGSASISETELEILDGATVTTAELNKLDGVTTSTAELNFVDGVTSLIQTQFTGKAAVAGNTGQVFSIASAGSSLTRAIRRTDRATTTLDGTIRVRLSGTDLFMTNDGTNP